MEKECTEYRKFVWQLNNLLKNKVNNKKIYILCIGTISIKGDSFGPKVGSMLKSKIGYKDNIKILGDYETNISYHELKKVSKEFERNIVDKYIIAIDATLSEEYNIGKIFVSNKGIKYGEALKKNNTYIGDISIKGIVGKNKNNRIKNYNELKNSSDIVIEKLVKIVSNGIAEVVQNMY
ncbi:MAG: DUF1256 domain-containing protein [Clostridiales bacterium]|nr:DUF1256 domain-containing protein [Clostridiales bacterium]